MKINQLKKENNLQSTLSVAENISKLISKKQDKNTGKVIRLSKIYIKWNNILGKNTSK